MPEASFIPSNKNFIQLTEKIVLDLSINEADWISHSFLSSPAKVILIRPIISHVLCAAHYGIINEAGARIKSTAKMNKNRMNLWRGRWWGERLSTVERMYMVSFRGLYILRMNI